MAYTSKEALEAVIPENFLERAYAIEGEADGTILAQILTNVDAEIDGYLGARYEVPLAAPIPGLVANAALMLAADALYRRNGASDANPWAEAAKTVRSQLADLQSGRITLGGDIRPPVASFDTTTPLEFQ